MIRVALFLTMGILFFFKRGVRACCVVFLPVVWFEGEVC